jgi:hypothetical protein
LQKYLLKDIYDKFLHEVIPMGYQQSIILGHASSSFEKELTLI